MHDDKPDIFINNQLWTLHKCHNRTKYRPHTVAENGERFCKLLSFQELVDEELQKFDIMN